MSDIAKLARDILTGREGNFIAPPEIKTVFVVKCYDREDAVMAICATLEGARKEINKIGNPYHRSIAMIHEWQVLQ